LECAGRSLFLCGKREFYGEAYNGYLEHEEPGNKIVVDNADYDFSESVRSIDVGMSLGAHYAIDKDSLRWHSWIMASIIL
jgi:hypothetical protein